MSHTEFTNAEKAILVKRNNHENKIRSLEKQMASEREAIKDLSALCEHRVRKHTPRPCAEADAYDTCEVCGIVV